MNTTGRCYPSSRVGILGRLGRPLVVAATCIVSAMPAHVALSQEIPRRSIEEAPRHPDDENRRPRYPFRASHQAWEVHRDRYVVVCKTSRADAEWAADQIDGAWEGIESLADAWTTSHRRPGFARGTMTVVIDSAPPRERDLPLATLATAADYSVLYLNVAPGMPPLAEQAHSLRAATVRAFLHAAELDRKLPEWVQTGLAEYVARDRGSDREPKDRGETHALPERGGDVPSGARPAADRIAAMNVDAESSGDWVAYLLEGDDARHAPAFQAALAEAIRQAERSQHEQVPPKRFGARPASYIAERPESLESVLRGGGIERDAASWLADPYRGMPVLQPKPGETAEQTARLREMAVVLKLLARFPLPAPARVQPKILAFGPDGQRDISPPASQAAAPSLAALHEFLTGPDVGPWATIDVNGRPLTAGDHERLASLLGVVDRRYETRFVDGRMVVGTRLGDGTLVEGWLEETRNEGERPPVRYRTVSPTGVVAGDALPAAAKEEPTAGPKILGTP
jgi:hypothetical protein